MGPVTSALAMILALVVGCPERIASAIWHVLGDQR